MKPSIDSWFREGNEEEGVNTAEGIGEGAGVGEVPMTDFDGVFLCNLGDLMDVEKGLLVN